MKESTSLKEEAARSRRDGKMLEEQSDEANREAKKVVQELDRLKKEIAEGMIKSDEESEVKDKQIFELQQHNAEKEEKNKREHDKSVEEKELQEKESEAKYRQISDLQLKTTGLYAKLEAAKKHILKLRQQLEQKDEAKMTREQNWDEYRQFWRLSAAPSSGIPSIAGPPPAPKNTPLVRLSPRIYMPVRPQTISLAQKVQIGLIQSANVVTRSRPTGSTHATAENAPIMASGVAVSPASGPGAPPQTISSGHSTPLASDRISSCTTRAQYLGLEFSKQIPRVRMPPPATPIALPAGDISIILQNPSLDSDVVMPNNLPRSSTLREVLGEGT